MVFGRLGVLNVFLTYGTFNLIMGLLGCNPIVSPGRSVGVISRETLWMEKIKDQVLGLPTVNV